MSKLALYQKYRSSTFDEVVGQEVTVRTIQNAIRTNQVGHAYLFCGPRGTGKTTMARLLAKAVNCEHPDMAPCEECANCRAASNGTHPDIIEINAANETHVEDVRDLIERSKLAPMMGKHKVYIIDEVHQLSSAASSALLKTLEEPPENVIFILATTDPQKLLPTIISRCQQFNFFRIRTDQIQNHLLDIASKENIVMDEKAAYKIAILANGGMRDALSIMDQCASFSNNTITEENVDTIYGLTSIDEQMQLLCDIFDKNIESIVRRIESYESHGIDISRMMDTLIENLKEAVIYSYTKKEDLLKVLSKENAEVLLDKENPNVLLKLSNVLMEGKEKLHLAQSAYSAFEVICLEMTMEQKTPSVVSNTAPVPSVQPVRKTESVIREKKQDIPVVKEEKKPEIVVDTSLIETQTVELNEDTVLGILQICNKDEKMKAQEKMNSLSTLIGLENAKFKRQLQDVQIAASGQDVVLFEVREQYTADRLNAPKENRELYSFLKNQLGMDKMPFVITEQDFKKYTLQFVQRRKAGSLPDPYHVIRYVADDGEEKTPEEKMKELFGEENIKII